MDVFSAGEQPIPGVSGKTVVNSVRERRGGVWRLLRTHAAPTAVVIAQHVQQQAEERAVAVDEVPICA